MALEEKKNDQATTDEIEDLHHIDPGEAVLFPTHVVNIEAASHHATWSSRK